MTRVILIVLAILQHVLGEGVIVKIQQGELKGTKDVSRGSLPYFSFRGIPYAKPPLDDLRFQDPQIPPESWKGIRDADKYGNDCPQFGQGEIKGLYGNEDCLFLNVFTPQVNSFDGSGLPVMVWIHGGAFRVGTGSNDRPDYFMDKQVVIVTINYRLGPLGFLCLDNELKGNYGMKDQVAALQWVKNNIRVFGGDPDRVTIAGQSAGGASVHWHMLSKLSDGLFHRAISQSGVATSPWAALPRRIANDRGLMVTRRVGCNYESAVENVKCLKRIPAYELVNAHEKSAHSIIVSENEDDTMWKLKTLNPKVSWLVGVTSQEAQLWLLTLLTNDGKDLKEFNDTTYQMTFPNVFGYGVNSRIQTVSETTAITEKIRQFYVKNKTMNNETFYQLSKMLQESFLYDVTEAALKHRGPTYYYIFDHLQEHPFTELVNKNFKPTGAVHCDDTISLFKVADFPQHFNSADQRVSNLMIDMWTNFIATGDPNSANLGFQWTPLSGPKIEYLSINENPKMKSCYWKRGLLFWRSLNLHDERDESPSTIRDHRHHLP